MIYSVCSVLFVTISLVLLCLILNPTCLAERFSLTNSSFTVIFEFPTISRSSANAKGPWFLNKTPSFRTTLSKAMLNNNGNASHCLDPLVTATKGEVLSDCTSFREINQYFRYLLILP